MQNYKHISNQFEHGSFFFGYSGDTLAMLFMTLNIDYEFKQQHQTKSFDTKEHNFFVVVVNANNIVIPIGRKRFVEDIVEAK